MISNMLFILAFVLPGLLGYYILIDLFCCAEKEENIHYAIR